MFCKWISACCRETLGESRTMRFARVRPSEELPRSVWRLPSEASSQAPSSSDASTTLYFTKKSWSKQSISGGGLASFDKFKTSSANPRKCASYRSQNELRCMIKSTRHSWLDRVSPYQFLALILGRATLCGASTLRCRNFIGSVPKDAPPSSFELSSASNP